MSVLAYSELLKRIAGVNEQKLEEPFKILHNSNTTATRLKVIKTLAKYEPITLGKLLKIAGFPTGGGSYMTIRAYFYELEKKGLLKSSRRGKAMKKTYWEFTEKGEEMKKYILR